jgi:hypothetical protein
MSTGLPKLFDEILTLCHLIPLKTHPCHLENTVQEVDSIRCMVLFARNVIKDLQYRPFLTLISFVTFLPNDVQQLFQVNQKVQYVGIFGKS